MSRPLVAVAALGCAITTAAAAPPALTIYNQNFAVVRETIALDLKQGVNDVRFAETTAHLEPASIILRDPTGKAKLQVLEQNYRNDPVSQERLLSIFEGKTVDFLVAEPTKPSAIIQGKIVRSGYVPHAEEAGRRYRLGNATSQSDENASNFGASSQPIIETNGKLRFGLPGQPLFPQLGSETILKPTLDWKINANQSGKLDAELCYLTGGMGWEADYNALGQEGSESLELVGWITMDNQSGRTFENAKIKLMAGDVSKIPRVIVTGSAIPEQMAAPPPVSEKAFDDYHLYTLERPTTLHDHETKQVEFIRATEVQAKTFYVYDGLKVGDWFGRFSKDQIIDDPTVATESDSRVAVGREIKNSEANHLGLPLPQGRIRFYKQDSDRQLEFTGENFIDHTPKDETIRIYTGNAFDLMGERRQTSFKIDTGKKWLDEAFEIKVRNHKKQAAEIRVVEHLFRWFNWEITQKSDPFLRTDARTIEFRVQLKPDEEKTVHYRVHYSQ